jgi:hypothetical protein
MGQLYGVPHGILGVFNTIFIRKWVSKSLNFPTDATVPSVFIPSNLLYIGCLMEFYKCLSLYCTKMCFKIVKFSYFRNFFLTISGVVNRHFCRKNIHKTRFRHKTNKNWQFSLSQHKSILMRHFYQVSFYFAQLKHLNSAAALCCLIKSNTCTCLLYKW